MKEPSKISKKEDSDRGLADASLSGMHATMTEISKIEAAVKTEKDQAKVREMYVRLGKLYSEVRFNVR